MKLFEKKQLIMKVLKDGSVKHEWVPETKLKEWELTKLADVITQALKNPPKDRRKKDYLHWIESVQYTWSRYQQLLTEVPNSSHE